MNPRHHRLVSILASVAILAVYGVSFVLPAVDFGKHGSDSGAPSGICSGLGAFFFALFASLFSFGLGSWLANPALCVGVILLCVNRPLAGGVAGAIGLAFGVSAANADVLVGYYLWMGSMAMLAAAGFALWRAKVAWQRNQRNVTQGQFASVQPPV